jgi:transposase InsO family protein
MQTDPRIIAFITSFRNQYGNKSKYVIKPFLNAFTSELNIPSVGVTTIGKIIRRKRLFTLRRKRWSRKRFQAYLRIKHAPREKVPGYIEMDSITVYCGDKRHMFMSVIDVVTKLAHVEMVSALTARQALYVFNNFRYTHRCLTRQVQTDNGHEFLGEFHLYLEQQQIPHVFTYPHSPRINGVVERFNRTIQEECIERIDELFYDQVAFRQKLSDYLIWYNTKRPHHALKLIPPIEYYHQLTSFPKCG